MEDYLILAIGAGAAAASLAGILLLLAFRPKQATGGHEGTPETVLLFRNGEVVDHTTDAAELFNRTVLTGMGWDEVREALLPGFPDLPEDAPVRPICWTSASVANADLLSEPSGNRLRLRLRCSPEGAASLFRARCQQEEHLRLVDLSNTLGRLSRLGRLNL